jgi:hypothetical protein
LPVCGKSGYHPWVTKSWRDEHPFWTGVIVGVAGLFAWSHRGWIMGIGRKLMHPSQLFHGLQYAFGSEIAGIEQPSSDPAVAMRQLRRYGFAAAQDQSPVVGLTHASYALICADILEETLGREKLMTLGCDIARIRPMVAKLQDMHAQKLAACDGYLAQALATEQGAALHGDGVEYIAPTGA